MSWPYDTIKFKLCAFILYSHLATAVINYVKWNEIPRNTKRYRHFFKNVSATRYLKIHFTVEHVKCYVYSCVFVVNVRDYVSISFTVTTNLKKTLAPLNVYNSIIIYSHASMLHPLNCFLWKVHDIYVPTIILFREFVMLCLSTCSTIVLV